MGDKTYLGIDLGTSNSAVSVFKGSKAHVLRNTLGDINTPSVVRVTGDEVIVGIKAKRKLHIDTQNTFKEFKRLMGTNSQTEADLNGKSWSPEQLSSEVLKSLKNIAEHQESCLFDKVVITVPALFELPQSKATASAAQLAGFDKVELLPEPVASALASGWDDGQDDIAWLVYDLGGGTFDVSLLESRDGLLRVVAHDGDNFLGGRDIDHKIVDWLEEQLQEQFGNKYDTEAADFESAKRHIQNAVEQAKIRLSDSPETIIEIDTEINHQEIQLDVSFTRDNLNKLSQPLIDRSVKICKRLIKSQGLSLNQIGKVVLVGGPAHMPIIRESVEKEIALVAESESDPMSLVSKGAAIYSATIGLACNAEKDTTPNEANRTHQVWLQYPSICTELSPSIMGRIIDDSFKPAYIQLLSCSATWKSPVIDIDDSGMFIIDAAVSQGKNNIFELKAFDENNQEIEIRHDEINIMHGLTISDPPLSRSIGVALANGNVRTFIERGTPLPAKRTFTQSSIDTLSPEIDNTLIIPIVQGERKKARFCRNVGSLDIRSRELKHSLNVGAPIEITIEVDRGGNLQAQAFIPDQSVIINGVAQLVMSYSSLDEIRTNVVSFNSRVNAAMVDAFRDRDERLIARLDPLVIELKNIQAELTNASDDIDTCQRLSRNLIEIEAEIELMESEDEIDRLAEEVTELYYSAQYSVLEYGDDVDKNILHDCAQKIESAVKNKRKNELERLVERLEAIEHGARKKSPDYWVDLFNYWSSFKNEASNPKQINSLIQDGEKMVKQKDTNGLKGIVNQIYVLLPQHVKKEDTVNYDSGIY